MADQRSAICPDCGKRITLNRDGFFRPHGHPARRCKSSGEAPPEGAKIFRTETHWPQTGTCSRCGNTKRVKQDGTVSKHYDSRVLPLRPQQGYCPGSDHTPREVDVSDTTNPTAADQAAEHLIEKLQQMADDAMRVAEQQDKSAEDEANYKRRIGHEESAAFHRALASEIDEVLHKLRARSAGYPGAPGDAWQDNEGDVWVLCADGQMRMVSPLVDSCGSVAVAVAYGPLLPIASEQASSHSCDNCDGIAPDVCLFNESRES